MQIFADVIQRKIETTNQPKMAGAIGAAMCVFVGSGVYKSFEDVNKIVKKHKVFNPDPANFEIYNKLFTDYKNIYRSLKGTYINANNKRFNLN
jgi:sugar (pentulose or hexulose) kinase